MTTLTLKFEDAVARSKFRQARIRRRVALLTITVPFVATIVAIAGIAYPSWFELAMMFLLYLLTVLGITVGYHRLLAHRSFTAPTVVRAVLTMLGAMAAQGSPIFWVSEHREHHRHSDQPQDPHTPYLNGMGLRVGGDGFWHAHIGWMLSHHANAWTIHAPELLRDPVVRSVDRWYFAWVAAGIVLPGIFAALWHHTLLEAALGVLWGGLVRVCLVHQATWSVNSICHVMGKRPFATADLSRNNGIVALLTLGEGWHNNHHAFPYSARQGLTRWELDPSYALIRLLAKFGLATNIRVPSAERIADAKHAPRNAEKTDESHARSQP
jgi:stearoyl-CoA desaturase (delta-9 desaturase)